MKEQKEREYNNQQPYKKGNTPVVPPAGGATLFVRNIGYDTNQDDFKAFMEKFGPVKYAVLCKQKEIEGADSGDKTKNDENAIKAHRGTGFVQFKDPAVA